MLTRPINEIGTTLESSSIKPWEDEMERIIGKGTNSATGGGRPLTLAPAAVLQWVGCTIHVGRDFPEALGADDGIGPAQSRP